MNRMLKFISLGLLPFCFLTLSYAQDAANFSQTALDLSRTFPGGTARISGLGSAQTALGGDISAASSNPAGLGFFNRSELSFSPSFYFVNSTSDYIDNSVQDSKLKLNLANLGVVINRTKSALDDSKWRGGSFGISMNRIADFQNQISYEGNSFNQVENGQVILDPSRPKDFIEYAVLSSEVDDSGNIIHNNDFSELAYQTFLIDVFSINDTEYIVDRDIYIVDENGNIPVDADNFEIYTPAFPEPDFKTNQRETINSSGGITQTSFSYGGNYNDQVYVGAGIGILSMNRDVERVYTETPTQTTLQELILTDVYNISGIGINLSLGLIARPITPLLVGLSFTTPSTYSLEQTQETTLRANYRRATNYRQASEEDAITYAPFNYNLTTPAKLKAGITYFFGKNGFITGDIERIDYGGAKLREGDESFDAHNQDIDNFESGLNYRVGGEYRIGSFRIRTGYSYQDDPTDNSFDNSESLISFGGGFRNQNMFLDLAVVNSLGSTSTVTPYPGAQVAEVTNKNTTATISVGFFF